MRSNLPGVSVIVPVLNEVRCLEKALKSLIDSGYPRSKLEFILVDGGSIDGTLELVEKMREQFKDVVIRLLHNDLRVTPAALNIGIGASKNDIILRADAHALYSEGYIPRSVELLESGAGDNIGGIVKSIKGETVFSELLACLLNSELGNGGAAYRQAQKGRLVDTVWCGCWYKSTLEKVGMFDLEWTNNQDAELNARLISQGFRIYCDPQINACLVVRPTLKAFVHQYYKYGRGRFRTINRHPSILRIRQLLPVFFVAALLLLGLLYPMPTITFLAISSFVSIYVFRKREAQFSNLPALMQISIFPLAVLMNLSWVAGLAAESLIHLIRLSSSRR